MTGTYRPIDQVVESGAFHHDVRRASDRARCARLAVYDRHGVRLHGVQAARLCDGERGERGVAVRVWIQPGAFAPDDDPVDAFVPGGYVRYVGDPGIPPHLRPVPDPGPTFFWTAVVAAGSVAAAALLVGLIDIITGVLS